MSSLILIWPVVCWVLRKFYSSVGLLHQLYLGTTSNMFFLLLCPPGNFFCFQTTLFLEELKDIKMLDLHFWEKPISIISISIPVAITVFPLKCLTHPDLFSQGGIKIWTFFLYSFLHFTSNRISHNWVTKSLFFIAQSSSLLKPTPPIKAVNKLYIWNSFIWLSSS
jgi:hypothetical protein